MHEPDNSYFPEIGEEVIYRFLLLHFIKKKKKKLNGNNSYMSEL